MCHRRSVLPFALLIIAVACAPWPNLLALGAARTPEPKAHPLIQDSPQALKQQLNDVLKVARSHRSDLLRAMIRDFEIPDPRSWYPATFGASGSEIAEAYEKNLRASEERLEYQMTGFAREDGYFSVRKQRAKQAYPEETTAPDVLLASWEMTPTHEDYFSHNPIGYFLFVDGKFRWDSTIMWVTVD